MSRAVESRKILHPVRESTNIKIRVWIYWLMIVCIGIALGMISIGFGMIVKSLVISNLKGAGIGLLIALSALFPLLIGLIATDISTPNNRDSSDALILYLWRLKRPTNIVKEVDVHKVLKIGHYSPKRNTVDVTLQPETLGKYSVWNATLPGEFLQILKPGQLVRYRRVLYFFPGWNEGYENSHKVIVYDENEKVIAVSEIYNKKNRRGITGVGKNGFKITKLQGFNIKK